MVPPVLDNGAARRVFLHRHLLGDTPQGPGRGDDLRQLIRRLGFVQVDSVNTVERAHHMILFARRPAYRPANLRPLVERHRHLFEHWTHDAAVVPSEFFPHWRLRFQRDGERLHEKWTNWQGGAYLDEVARVLAHIRESGAVRSGDLTAPEHKGKSGGWWDWHPSKTALEYLWRTGKLAVARRDGFTKIYDLTERVLPAPEAPLDPAATVDFFNHAALDRLGFATSGQIAAFWGHVKPAETADWCRAEVAAGRIEPVTILGADGQPRRHFARPGLLDEAAELAPPSARLRVLSPFDPAIRDRNRTEFLFGYHYRIEIFVPEAKRQYGYYVFPLLEGDRLIGRIDMKARRGDDVLAITRLWLEPGVRASKGRLARLDAELTRVARFAAVSRIAYASGWLG
ncbi:crosslink repair DNA glycosylase YcaQ family protein [Pseudooceanicola sp.]|uniref:winged helix-turn-helix domain-containing protein n=1 Tax=Pseudooceanicola sp. TaxID=1914328 RepID=UPI002629F7FB|nr:crosslink repair DNA glycosylase YcaQ family protein [Pseudooceanicola sp.]MDF1855023.1 crosslink repair DNA glycosylase YcaQ family protein [Pseudooceanicola sp.]